ncbi:DUF4097 family beta strand repeat-containing protein [Pedobacter sp. AW1-32]|uniref:DUF4097 family beta strand repeat-containing protein n=1 Tax=Pedobacter sp. AW1-32 TaxID=3383026 RepID=UPI003FF0714D
MKKKITLLLTLFALSLGTFAQKEYKLAKSSGRLNINLPGATIIGYNGKDIVFSAAIDEEGGEDLRAKGLKMINGNGFTDNTGLGIDVSVSGEEINVNTVGKKLDGAITIKVPENIKIVYKYSSTFNRDSVILQNLKNEIEVSASYNSIKLQNNSGPMNIKTLYGSVDATFNSDIKGPVSIVSVYGYVDVAIPPSTKANVELSTSYGNLYSADGLKIAIDKTATASTPEKQNGQTMANVSALTRKPNATSSVIGANEPAVAIATSNSTVQGKFTTSSSSSNTNTQTISTVFYGTKEPEAIKGKLNGGGTDLILKSNYKNVYLRSK